MITALSNDPTLKRVLFAKLWMVDLNPGLRLTRAVSDWRVQLSRAILDWQAQWWWGGRNPAMMGSITAPHPSDSFASFRFCNLKMPCGEKGRQSTSHTAAGPSSVILRVLYQLELRSFHILLPRSLSVPCKAKTAQVDLDGFCFIGLDLFVSPRRTKKKTFSKESSNDWNWDSCMQKSARQFHDQPSLDKKRGRFRSQFSRNYLFWVGRFSLGTAPLWRLLPGMKFLGGKRGIKSVYPKSPKDYILVSGNENGWKLIGSSTQSL